MVIRLRSEPCVVELTTEVSASRYAVPVLRIEGAGELIGMYGVCDVANFAKGGGPDAMMSAGDFVRVCLRQIEQEHLELLAAVRAFLGESQL